jgi:selenoprotein W-related protein
LTTKIAGALKQNMSELALAPYADGRFEVIVDGETIYSKLETGDFPDEDTIVAKLKKRS